MKIRIRDDSVAVDDRLQAHLERRLDFALSSFGDRVGGIVVRLSRAESTLDSPLDRCELEVVLLPRTLRVADTGADLFIAVANAAERLTRSVARALERERAWHAGAGTDGRPAPPARRRRK